LYSVGNPVCKYPQAPLGPRTFDYGTFVSLLNLSFPGGEQALDVLGAVELLPRLHLLQCCNNPIDTHQMRLRFFPFLAYLWRAPNPSASLCDNNLHENTTIRNKPSLPSTHKYENDIMCSCARRQYARIQHLAGCASYVGLAGTSVTQSNPLTTSTARRVCRAARNSSPGSSHSHVTRFPSGQSGAKP